MAGFLSAYDGTERLEFGRGYWADVKRCLSHAEQQRAQAKLGAGRQSVDMSGRMSAVVDMNAFETEMIVLSVVGWNFDDDDGTIWPLAPEAALRESIARLPAPVASRIFQVCNEFNGPMEGREAATFPGPGVGGDQGGVVGAAGAGVVPDPESVLGEAGADPSGSVVASVA
jgi:hypothetical protein